MRRRAFLRASSAVAGLSLLGTTGATSDGSERASRGAGTQDEQAYSPFGSVDVEGAREAVVAPDEEVAYVAASDGFAVVDISEPESPTILAERREIDTNDQGPFEVVWDLWPWGDRLAVVGPAQPSPGTAHGVAIFDTSDPADPEQVAWYGTEFHIHNSFFTDGTVYLTGSGVEESPLVIVDVTDDEPVEVNRWSLLDHEPDWESITIRSRVIHDVTVQDGIAYLPYWDAGTWVVDVSDPENPEVLSRVGDFTLAELQALAPDEALMEAGIPPGNAHYTDVNEDASVLAVGKEAWAGTDTRTGEIVGGPGGVDLWDIEDPADPKRLATIEAPESYDQTTGGWFTTAHNLDIVDDRLYTSWYYGGVKVHDVSDPQNPEEIAWWRDPTETSFWTAQAGPGDFFVASSLNISGVFDGPNPTREALYTFPDRPGTQENPVDLTDPPDEGGGEETPTSTPTPEEIDSSTPTPTETASNESISAGTDSDGTGTGFTIGGAIAALGGAYYLTRRRKPDN
jgi:hypothetical protein